MFSDGAERASAETAAHDIYRKADHLVRRQARLAIGGVRHTCIWLIEHVVHLLSGQRNGWRC